MAVVELAMSAFPKVALFLVLLGGATSRKNATNHPGSYASDEKGLEMSAFRLVQQKLGIRQLVPFHGLLSNSVGHSIM